MSFPGSSLGPRPLSPFGCFLHTCTHKTLKLNLFLRLTHQITQGGNLAVLRNLLSSCPSSPTPASPNLTRTTPATFCSQQLHSIADCAPPSQFKTQQLHILVKAGRGLGPLPTAPPQSFQGYSLSAPPCITLPGFCSEWRCSQSPHA